VKARLRRPSPIMKPRGDGNKNPWDNGVGVGDEKRVGL